MTTGRMFWVGALLAGIIGQAVATASGLFPTGVDDKLNPFTLTNRFVPSVNWLSFHVAMPDGGDGLVVSGLKLSAARLAGLSITLDAQRVDLQCRLAQFAGLYLRQSEDLVHWTDTGIRFDPDRLSEAWGPPAKRALFFRIEPELSLDLSAPAADATTIQLKWPPLSNATEYQVFRDGVNVGSTAGRIGHYLDAGLAPSTTYAYRVSALDQGGHVLGRNARASFS